MGLELKRVNPELFIWELYNQDGLLEIDEAIESGASFGICDSERLPVRPRSGLYGLMMEFVNGDKCWCHIDEELKKIIEKRLEKKEKEGRKEEN